MSNFKEDVRPLAFALPTESLSRNVRRALVLLTLVALVLVETEILSPVRSIVVLAWMCTVPGAAVMSFTRRTDGLTIAALSVAFSLAICAAIASVAVWTGNYAPDALFVATAVVSTVLLFLAPWYRNILNPVGARRRVNEGES